MIHFKYKINDTRHRYFSFEIKRRKKLHKSKNSREMLIASIAYIIKYNAKLGKLVVV